MKCPSCSRQHKHSSGMVCKCGYAFALDPKTDHISDRRFVSFILAASCNSTYHFTENQLYTAACRKQLSFPLSMVIFLSMITVGFFIAGIVLDPFILVGLGVPAIGFLTGLYTLYFKKLSHAKFDGWLLKYVKHKGPIENMIVEESLLAPPIKAEEPDIFDYGVEKVLLVQHRILVDLLVANNIHMATRALISTADEYPKYLTSHLNKLLNESQDLQVFLLHDATTEGINWAGKLEKKFRSSRRPVFDMGLTPNAIKRIKKLKTLRLKDNNYRAPIDCLPMAMLANGISLSLGNGISMEEMLIAETTTDSLASFG